jgi:ribosomal protein L37E
MANLKIEVIIKCRRCFKEMVQKNKVHKYCAPCNYLSQREKAAKEYKLKKKEFVG